MILLFDVGRIWILESGSKCRNGGSLADAANAMHTSL